MATTSELLEPFFLSDDPEAVLAASRAIATLSSGELTTAERCNPRTRKPENGGLFCARIFGPVEDYRCLCGYLRDGREQAGQTCPKCGVLCGEKKLRDERWAHVGVPWPLLHPVLAKRVAEVLECREKDVGLVAGFMANLNADGSVTKLRRDQYEGDEYTRTDRGPEFVRGRLAARDRGDLVVSAVPVTPAGWRGSRRDLQDDAYGRLVNRRHRLARLLQLNAPPIILENDYRQLQQCCTRVWTTVRAELGARRGRVAVPRDGQHAELLNTVLERPIEYGVRGVYADWLIEHGDPRGEFITLQLANAGKVAMGKRESELLARHYDEWIAPLADVVDFVVFRRGFLASCRAQKPALPFVGDPVWSTVEHLDTEVPELVRQPTLRALSKLTTNARCLAKLCAEAPLPQLTALNVRLSRVPPRGWAESVTALALPAVRELVLLHQSAQGESDWSWFLGTPLARQLTSLTLAMAIERLDQLAVSRWLPIFDAHPTLERLALTYDKKRLAFELQRTAGGVELALTTTPSIVEQMCMMQENTISPAISRALSRIPTGALARVKAASNVWYGPDLEALAKTLRRRFKNAITLPELRRPE